MPLESGNLSAHTLRWWISFFEERGHCEAQKKPNPTNKTQMPPPKKIPQNNKKAIKKNLKIFFQYSRAQWERRAFPAVKWESGHFPGNAALLSAGWERDRGAKGTHWLRHGQLWKCYPCSPVSHQADTEEGAGIAQKKKKSQFVPAKSLQVRI